MPYIDVAGRRAYSEVSGSGEPLLLLHGGFCSLEVMRELADLLAERFEVHAVERPGHGRSPDVEGPYSYQAMVDHTLAYLDTAGIEKAHVVGYSDGGITGLLLARDHPGRIRTLVAISANLDETGWVTDDEMGRSVSAEQHDQVTAEYEQLTPDGAGHRDEVLKKLYDLWEREPRITTESLGTIEARTMVMAGDHDYITLEHTARIAGGVKGAQLCVVPGSGHLLVRERPGLIAGVVTEFMEQ